MEGRTNIQALNDVSANLNLFETSVKRGVPRHSCWSCLDQCTSKECQGHDTPSGGAELLRAV